MVYVKYLILEKEVEGGGGGGGGGGAYTSKFFSEKYMQLSQAHVVTHIYTLCIIIVIWDSPGVLANRKSWRFKLKIHHIMFRTQFCRALISKVKIRNDAVADFKGADRGPKFISSTEVLCEVLRVVIYCQNWQNVILYYSLWWKKQTS